MTKTSLLATVIVTIGIMFNSQADAAFSIRQKAISADNSTASGLTSIAATGTTTIASGDCVLGFVMYFNAYTGAENVPSSVVDNATTQDTFSVLEHMYDSTNGNGLAWFGGCSTHSGTATGVVTVNWSGGDIGYTRVAWIEVGGATAIDKHASSVFQPASSSPITTATVTPTQSGDFLYGAFANTNGGESVTFTAGTNVSWGLQNNGGGSSISEPMADETITSPYSYNSTSAVGASIGTNFTGTGDYYAGAIIALSPSSSGGGGGCVHGSLLLLGVGC